MPEKDYLILTASGPDRVGLVEKLSEFISRHGCNIEDSKMAAFCGEFALIILITGEAGQLAGVARDYRGIESETGLTIATTLFPHVDPLGKSLNIDGRRFQVVGVIEKQGKFLVFATAQGLVKKIHEFLGGITFHGFTPVTSHTVSSMIRSAPSSPQ